MNEAGETEVMTGVGVGAETGSVLAREVPPPGVGFVTVTARFEATAWSATDRTKVSWVELRTVAVRAVLPTDTVVAAVKFRPVTVMVVGVVVPTIATAGASELMKGTG